MNEWMNYPLDWRRTKSNWSLGFPVLILRAISDLINAPHLFFWFGLWLKSTLPSKRTTNEWMNYPLDWRRTTSNWSLGFPGSDFASDFRFDKCAAPFFFGLSCGLKAHSFFLKDLMDMLCHYDIILHWHPIEIKHFSMSYL
jgi:hypothetical protein